MHTDKKASFDLKWSNVKYKILIRKCDVNIILLHCKYEMELTTRFAIWY